MAKILLYLSIFLITNCYGEEQFKSESDFIFGRSNEIIKPKNHAKIARELVHKADWTSMGTISTLDSIKGYPMVNIISVADSPRGGRSTGNIYFYLTNLDYTGQDLKKNNHITTLFSNEQDLSCSRNRTDAMEPTCARAIISGTLDMLINGTSQYTYGKSAFLSRHPAAVKWLNTHSFYLCKLNIENIIVLDWYGGPHNISLHDYYNVELDDDKYDTTNGNNQVVEEESFDTKKDDPILIQIISGNFGKSQKTINIKL